MTEATAETDGLIKQDKRGRMRVTRERRQMLVAEFEHSAMTGRQFAALAGIKATTFSNWVRRWRKPPLAQLPAPAVENGAGSALAGGGGGKAHAQATEENSDGANRTWTAWRASGAGG
jgi:transposase-like protein